jgi:hypothetical protein
MVTRKAAKEIGALAGSSVKVAERSGKLIVERVPVIRKTAGVLAPRSPLLWVAPDRSDVPPRAGRPDPGTPRIGGRFGLPEVAKVRTPRLPRALQFSHHASGEHSLRDEVAFVRGDS